MNPESIHAKILMIALGLITGAFPAFTLGRKIHFEGSQEELRAAELRIVALKTEFPTPATLPPDEGIEAIAYLKSLAEKNRQELNSIEALISETESLAKELQAQIDTLTPQLPAEDEDIDFDELASAKWKELRLPDSEEIENLLAERKNILQALESDNPDLEALRADAQRVDARIKELAAWDSEKIETTIKKLQLSP